MQEINLLIHSASQVCVVPTHDGPQRGDKLGDLGIVEDGAVAVKEGKIVAVGKSTDLRVKYTAVTTIDAGGRCVTPGFVDPHTHLPWVGNRANEFEMRLGGATYMEIMAAGGGIMSTVRNVRQASLDELVADNLPRLASLLRHGTTSVEAKTGYGLEKAAELKQLQVYSSSDLLGWQSHGLGLAPLLRTEVLEPFSQLRVPVRQHGNRE